MAPRKRKITFSQLWNVFTNFLTVCSIASLSDQYIVWVGFFQELINLYREIRDCFLVLPLSWLDFTYFNFFDAELPSWAGDYITLGTIVLVGPMFRVILRDSKSDAEKTIDDYNSWQQLGMNWGSKVRENLSIFKNRRTTQYQRLESCCRIVTSNILFVSLFFLLLIATLFFLYIFVPTLIWGLWPLILTAYMFHFLLANDLDKRRRAVAFFRSVFISLVAFAICLFVNLFVLRFLNLNITL